MAQHFKLNDIIKDEHRADLVKMALDKRVTQDQLHDRVTSLGYQVGRTAVWNWRGHIRQMEG